MARIALLAFLAACNSSPAATPATQTQAATTAAAAPHATSPSSRVTLPSAAHGKPPSSDAPIVSVVDGKIYFDDAAVGDTHAILDQNHLQRVDGLFMAAKAYREGWKSAHEGKDFPGVALFAFDAHAPSLVVKSVFQTMAYAGFPNGELEVRAPSGAVARLDADAIVPMPPMPNAPEEIDEYRLFINVTSSKLELVWKQGSNIVNVADVASVAELAERVPRDWKMQGHHTDPTDKHFDQAVVIASSDVDYAAIISAVDALATATRDYRIHNEVKTVPAYSTSLSMADPPDNKRINR